MAFSDYEAAGHAAKTFQNVAATELTGSADAVSTGTRDPRR